MTTRRDVIKWAATGTCLSPLAALAQPADYPSRMIRIIAGSAPGSATDLAGRLVSDTLGARYKQSVIVENRPGAGGVIAMQAVAAAPPDGYTLQSGGLGNNVIPVVTIKGLPIDIPKALVPVAQVGEFSNVLVLRVNHPARNVQEFTASCKAASAPPTFGSNGTGTSAHLTGELFALRSGFKALHVPYKNSSDALIGVANGELDFCFMNLPPSLPLITAGRLKAMAVTSGYRVRQLPKVPTMQEEGVSSFDVTSWLGIYMPAGAPAAVRTKLSNDIVEGLSAPEYQKRLEAAGFEPRFRRADEFTAWNQSELKRWAEVASAANISFTYGS